MILVNKSAGRTNPGFIDTTKTNPSMDPGLKTIRASQDEKNFIGDQEWIPETTAALVLGFEQTDGVARISKVTEDASGKKHINDKLMVIYDHNDLIVKAYELQDTPRGEQYVEIGEKGVYDLLKISDGTLKSAVSALIGKTQDHFAPLTPRRVVYSALNTIEKFVQKQVSYDGLNSAVRTFFRDTLKNNYAAYRESFSPEFREYVNILLKDELYKPAKAQGESDQYHVSKDVNGIFSKMIQSFYDMMKERGEESKMITDFKNEAARQESKDPRVTQDFLIILDKLASEPSKNMSAAPVVVAYVANSNPNEDAKKEPESDESLSSKIQALYDSADERGQADIKMILEAESRKRNRNDPKEAAFYIELAKSISNENPSLRLNSSPIVTRREHSIITRDNVERACKFAQGLYSTASHTDKVAFEEKMTSYLRDVDGSKYKSDLTSLLGRMIAEKPSDRLDANPVTGKNLVVSPTPAFFSYVHSIEVNRAATQAPDASDAAKDKFGIIESIARNAGLLEKDTSVWAVLGGITTAYSPEIDTVLVHDSRLVPLADTFDRYKTFSKDGIFKKLRDIMKRLGDNVPASSAVLAETKMPKEEIDRISSLSVADQKNAILKYIVFLNENYVNGRIKSPRPLVPLSIVEDFLKKQHKEQVDDKTFWGTAVHRERGILFGAPRDLMNIKLVEKDGGRPRINSGAGIPVDIAEYMAPGYNKQSRIPRKDRMAVVSFVKRHDFRKKDFGDSLDLKVNSEYQISNIVTPVKTQFFAINRNMAEELSRHIHALQKCDALGNFTYEVIENGVTNIKQGSVDAEKEIKGIIDILTENSKRDLGKGRIEVVTFLLSEIVTKVMPADSKISAIKDILFVNPNEHVKSVVLAALKTDPNRLYNLYNESYLARFNRTELDAATIRLSSAHQTGDWSASRYLQLNDYKGTPEQETSTKRTLSKMQYGINRSIDIGLIAMETLTKRGQAFLDESGRATNSRDGGSMPPIFYSKQFTEAERLCSLLRDESNMIVKDNRQYYIPVNNDDPYIRSEEIPESEREPGKSKNRTVIAIDPKAEAEKIKVAFRDTLKATSTDGLLKEAMTNNSAPSGLNFGGMLSEIAFGIADADALPSAEDVVSSYMQEATDALPSVEFDDVQLPIDDEHKDIAINNIPIVTEIEFGEDDFVEAAPTPESATVLAQMLLGGSSGSMFGMDKDEDDISYEEEASLFKNH